MFINECLDVFTGKQGKNTDKKWVGRIAGSLF